MFFKAPSDYIYINQRPKGIRTEFLWFSVKEKDKKLWKSNRLYGRALGAQEAIMLNCGIMPEQWRKTQGLRRDAHVDSQSSAAVVWCHVGRSDMYNNYS